MLSVGLIKLLPGRRHKQRLKKVKLFVILDLWQVAVALRLIVREKYVQ
jgi:hypothetical protein